MKKESGCMWRPTIGVLAIGLLAFGLSLQGAALHQGSAVPAGDPVVSVAVSSTVAATGAADRPASKTEVGTVFGSVDELAFLPTDGINPANFGSRIDDCTPRVPNSGDDCVDIIAPAMLLPRDCTTSGTPCLRDSDCPGGVGDICDETNTVYLTGDMILATRLGTCSSDGAPCEYTVPDCAQLGVCQPSFI